MVRTNLPPRSSTSGLPPRCSYRMISCTRSIIEFPSPKHRGPWASNRVGQRLVRVRYPDNRAPRTCQLDARDNVPEGRQVIIVPNHMVVGGKRNRSKAVKARPRKRKQSLTENADADVPIENSALLSLPSEILLQILSLRVRTGNVYHFAPKYTRDRCYTSIHYFSDQVPQPSPDDIDSDSNFPENADTDSAFNLDPPQHLALVCRRFKEIIYSLFYGRNQFVVEIAGHKTSVTSYVDVTDVVRDGKPEQHLLQSWNRLFPRSPQGLPTPFTAGTISHLTSLTLCINLTRTDCCGEEKEQIKGQIAALAKCFESGERHCLKRLCVSFDFLEERNGMSISKQTVLKRNRRSGYVEVDIGDHDTALRQRSTVEELLAPLLNIRSVQEVKAKGLICEAFGEEVRLLAAMPGEQARVSVKEPRPMEETIECARERGLRKKVRMV